MESVRQEVRDCGVDVDLYIDVIFFVNFFMDTLLLSLLRKWLKRPASRLRVMLGGGLGGGLGCLQALFPGLPGWAAITASFGGAALMTGVTFRPSDVRELVKETISLYLLAAVAGGLMEFLWGYTRAGFYVLLVIGGEKEFALPLLIWMFLAAGACFLAAGAVQFVREISRERSLRYLVTLTDGSVRVETTGYLDTGNCLREPKSGEAVQIVTERVWDFFAGTDRKKVLIPYHTVGNPYGMMAAVRIERMEICGVRGCGQEKRVKILNPWIARAPYGLTGDKSYEVLLHGQTVTEAWHREGGITSGD